MNEPEVDPSMAPPAPAVPAFAGPLAGLVSGGVAMGVGMLVAGIIEVVSPVDAVGSEVIDRVPRWVKEQAIRSFGTNDKLALRVGIWSVIAIAALVLGRFAVRRPIIGGVGIGVFGLIGAAAAAHRPGESGWAFLPPILGAAIGAPLLMRLVSPSRRGPLETPGPSRVPLGWDRRRFLVVTGTATGVAVVAGATAQALERQRVSDIEAQIPDSLPPTESTTSAVPATATVDDVTPFITPNDDFYRIDTALSFPRIDIDSWSMTIGGMVDNPLKLTYADLLAREQIERVVTLCCVSNEVGGSYIGTATWQGVLLKPLLEEAGVQAGAEQVFTESLDGFTAGFPVAAATDGRDAMVVVGMNGEALPLAHGFPVRLVVPGLYGYVSATKWLKSLTLTTWDEQGYWVPRGWAQLAPIKTQSRIDVPKRGDDAAAGSVVVAGVAWAQHRGIAKVEVRADDGEWVEATLADDISDDAWRQWRAEIDLSKGKHRLQVRATDKTGETQTEQVAPPAPDGATGYHTRTVNVT